MTSTIIPFIIASLALLLVPGPAVVFIVNRSMVDGRGVALASVAGLTLGNFFHALLAGIGVSAVLVASTTAFNIVKWLGVTYLVVVGIRTLGAKASAVRTSHETFGARRAFRQGMIVNLLNPKVALFFLAFIPQFVGTKTGGFSLETMILGGVFVSLGFLTDSMYALASSALRESLFSDDGLAFFRRWVSGFVFIALGVFAAFS